MGDFVVGYITEKKTLSVPTFELLYSGDSIGISSDSTQFVLAFQQGQPSLSIGGQDFSTSPGAVVAVVGAAAHLSTSSDALLLFLVRP